MGILKDKLIFCEKCVSSGPDGNPQGPPLVKLYKIGKDDADDAYCGKCEFCYTRYFQWKGKLQVTPYGDYSLSYTREGYIIEYNYLELIGRTLGS